MTVDWVGWLRRWDAQQEGYVPEREARFTAMLDVLASLAGEEFVALDLASGPGSISQRVLARFPRARAIAVDVDPVMLALGQGALGTLDGRLRWVEADLDTPAWLDALGETRVDAVLSSTALHWLWPEPLARVYGELADLLPPGGVLLNGDHLAYPATSPTFGRLSRETLDRQWSDDAFAARGLETAEHWWESFAAEPGTADLLERRARLFATKERQRTPPGIAVHVAALHAAGFREIDTVWQMLSDRVLLAVR